MEDVLEGLVRAIEKAEKITTTALGADSDSIGVDGGGDQ